MEWDRYESQSAEVLKKLVAGWNDDSIDSKTMNIQLTGALLALSEKLAPVKNICTHSKPWITTELSTQLKKQQEVKKKWKRHRSPKNYQEYHEETGD